LGPITNQSKCFGGSMNASRKVFTLVALLALTAACHASVITSWADDVGLITTFNATFTVGTTTTSNCIPLVCNTTNFFLNVPVSNVDYHQVSAAASFTGPPSISSPPFYYAPPGGAPSWVISGTYPMSLPPTSAGVNALDGVTPEKNRGSDWPFFGPFTAGTD